MTRASSPLRKGAVPAPTHPHERVNRHSRGACPRDRRVASALLLPLALLLTGCPEVPPTGPQPRPPATRGEALARVNENLARIESPLHCSGLVSFKLRDERGRVHSVNLNEARLLFRPPQDLLFDVRALTGTVAQFGSNDERFWLWLEAPDLRRLWWGSWNRVGDAGRRLPVPPNELLDALMLRPLPERLEGGLLPTAVQGDAYHLIFTRLGAGGQPSGSREVRFDSRPPFMPVEIIDRLPDGEVIMHARLGSYQPVGRDGPLTPRRYVVDWPRDEAQMRLDISAARFRDELDDAVFEFPADWKGAVTDIDSPGETNSP